MPRLTLHVLPPTVSTSNKKSFSIMPCMFICFSVLASEFGYLDLICIFKAISFTCNGSCEQQTFSKHSFNAEVIYPRFIQWSLVNRKGIDYLSINILLVTKIMIRHFDAIHVKIKCETDGFFILGILCSCLWQLWKKWPIRVD